jgi:hypothetical protein
VTLPGFMKNRGEDVKLASQGFADSPGPLAPIAGFPIRSNGTRHRAQPWMAADITRLVDLLIGLSALAPPVRITVSLLHTQISLKTLLLLTSTSHSSITRWARLDGTCRLSAPSTTSHPC